MFLEKIKEVRQIILMAEKKNYEMKAEELLKPIADQCGVCIYDVEYVKEGPDWYLRAYIDKDGGVSIEDCEKVSRLFSDSLDHEDFIADAYILEVSSPGLGRQLKKDRHLEQSIGMEVEVKLYEELDGSKEYIGVLKSFDKDTIVIDNDKDIVFERNKIANIKLTLDF